jgi:hypothetical protein
MFFPLPLAMPQEVQPQTEQTLAPRKTFVAGSKIYVPRVQKIADSFKHQLPSWTIVILDDKQWRSWADKNPHASITDGAFSLHDSGRTFISQDWLSKWPDERVKRNLAHELGHLTTKSGKEEDADKWADAYLKANK